MLTKKDMRAMIPEILGERSTMKRTILATVTLMLALAGLAAAQSADEDYLKAMRIRSLIREAMRKIFIEVDSKGDGRGLA